MRLRSLLVLVVFLSACGQASGPRELVLKPGNRGTFLAVGTETATSLDQAATANEPEFKYRIQVSPHRGISIGMAVGNEGQGDLGEKMFFTPASITKVVTASVALKLLGPDYRFRTRVSWLTEDEGATAKDLSISANGDPTSSKARLREIAVELKRRGIKRIVGKLNLYSADPRRDFASPAHGLDKEDYISCYGSRAQNFNLMRNCATVVVSGWNQARWADTNIVVPLRFDSVRQEAKRLLVLNDLQFGFHRGYVIQAVKVDAKPIHLGLPVPDAKSWYGNALVNELRGQGIDVSQATSSRDLTLTESDFFELESPPIQDLARTMNKMSDNWLADALYKAAASQHLDQSINDAAQSVVTANIADWLAMTDSQGLASELKLYEGAGLSRANKVTPRAFLSLLKAFTKEKWFPALWESLPIAGVDGTLRGRMGASPAGKLVRAKTGTLKGAYQLAGYIPKLGADGITITEYIPFVLLTATTPKNQGSARAFQDKLLGELADQINKKR